MPQAQYIQSYRKHGGGNKSNEPAVVCFSVFWPHVGQHWLGAQETVVFVLCLLAKA